MIQIHPVPPNNGVDVEEIWKTVVGYEDRFEVSSIGRLKSVISGKVLSQRKHPNGYMLHATKIGGRNGIALCFKIHRLVAEAFLPEPSDELKEMATKTKYRKIPVNHKDGNKVNNNFENLEWSSYSRNTQHAFDTGLIVVAGGVDNKNSFFDDKELIEKIRLRYIPFHKVHGARAMSREFGCDKSTITAIIHGETY